MKLRIKKRPSLPGITILQDSRETRPIQFSRDEVIRNIQRTKLEYGDYRAILCDGKPSKIVFERKSVADLWTTMTKGHNRFLAELERAKAERAKLVLIIEAPFSSILVGYDQSKYPGTAMVKKLWTLFYSYDLPFIFCQSRQDMSNYIAWSFIAEQLHHERAGGRKCQ